MKRRRFFQTLAAAPAAKALLAQQQPPASPPGSASVSSPAASSTEIPQLQTAAVDLAGEPVPAFFTGEQYAALRRLSDILFPAANGLPGALDAKVPEFLDFLISVSPADRQQLYRNGLDALNAEAMKHANQPFAKAPAIEATSLLAPLREPWTYDPPSDPLAHFLREAKQDVYTATVNSREYNEAAAAASGGRRFAARGFYWLPLE
jgi:hypothetical protein